MSAETKTIEADGSAPLGGDEASAKKTAMEVAQVNAVSQVVAGVVDFSHAKNLVKTYRLIDEASENGRYTVKLAVSVLLKPSSDDSRKLLRWSGNPRIMVVIPETLLTRPHVPDPAGETELVLQLIKAKFRVIESSDVAKIRYDDSMGRVVKESDISAMKAIGAKYQCDILIAGEAFADEVAPVVSEMITARARIEAKAFVVDTGEILAAGGEEAGASDISPAIAGKTALKKAAEKLARTLVPEIRDAITSENKTINIVITDLYGASQLDALEAGLKKIASVQSVQRRNFDATVGVATLDVETTLLTAQLSKELLAFREPLLTVKSSTSQQIQVGVVRR